MRTTLTLDEDVAQSLEEEAHRKRQTFKQTVNDAIRRGLSNAPTGKAKPYRVKAHASALQPGFDRLGFNRLADQLEDEAVLLKRRRSKP